MQERRRATNAEKQRLFPPFFIIFHSSVRSREPGYELIRQTARLVSGKLFRIRGKLGPVQRRQTAEPEAAPKAKPRVRSLSKAQVRQRQKVSILSVLGVGAAIGLAVLLMMGYIQLTAISDEVVSLQDQLAELETENVALTAQHEQMFDLATVKEVAEAAGMSKPSSSQIYYIDLSEGDSAVVYQQEETNLLSRLLTSLNHGIYAVVEYFE